MAVINQNEKWIYLFEPHTASRATQKELMKIEGSEEFGHHHVGLTEMTDPRRQKTTPLATFAGFDVICTVRNPFDVLVTNWKAGSSRDWEFDEWIEFNLHQSIVNVPLHRGLWQQANIICYYEYLQEDLNFIMGREVPLGYNQGHITHGKQHWSTYYNKSNLNLLLMYYQNFMDSFGYRFSDSKRTSVEVDELIRQRRRRRIGYGRYTS